MSIIVSLGKWLSNSNQVVVAVANADYDVTDDMSFSIEFGEN